MYYLLIDYFQRMGTNSKFAQLTKRRNSDIPYHIKESQASERGILNRNSIALGNLEEMNQRMELTHLQQEERSEDEDKQSICTQNVPEISFQSMNSTPSPTCTESEIGQNPFFLHVNPAIPQHIVNRRHTLGPLSFGEVTSSSEDRTYSPNELGQFIHVAAQSAAHSSQGNAFFIPEFPTKNKSGQFSSSHSSSCTPSGSPQPHPYLCYAQVKERRVSDLGYLKNHKFRPSEGQSANTLKRSHDEYTNLYTMEKSKFPKQSSKHKGALSKLVNLSQHKFSRNSATYPVQEDPDEQTVLTSESSVPTPVSDPPGDMTPTSGNLSANSPLFSCSPDPPSLTVSMPPSIPRTSETRPRSTASSYENYSPPADPASSGLTNSSPSHEQLQERLRDIHINQAPLHKTLSPHSALSESPCIRSLPPSGNHSGAHLLTDHIRANSDDLQLSTPLPNSTYPYPQTHAISGAKLENQGLNGFRAFLQIQNSLSLNNADFPSGAPTNPSLMHPPFYLQADLNEAVLNQPVAAPALDETLQFPHMTAVNTQNRAFLLK